MKVFILGPSGSGKTTLANQLANALDCPCISGGAWIREALNEYGHTPEIAQKLSEASREILRGDPLYCYKWLKGQVKDSPVVIEGLRNPLDFFGLWTPEDVVVFLEGEYASDFERIGLGAIRFAMIDGFGMKVLHNPKEVSDVLNVLQPDSGEG